MKQKEENRNPRKITVIACDESKRMCQTAAQSIQQIAFETKCRLRNYSIFLFPFSYQLLLMEC